MARATRVVLWGEQWVQHPVEPAHCLEDVARKPSHVLFAHGLGDSQYCSS